MAKGQTFDPERSFFVHEPSGVRIWRMTSSDCADTNFYFISPCWTADSKYFVFYSNRPEGEKEVNLFRMDIGNGKILQLTEEKDILPHSACLSRDGQKLFYAAQNRVCAISLSTLAEERVANLPKGCVQFSLFSANPDGKYLSAYFKYRDVGHIGYIDLEKKTLEFIAEEDGFMRTNAVTFGFPQFSPAENIMLYSHQKIPQSDIPQKMWVIDIGGYKHPLYRKQPKEWITHETWMPDGKGVLFVNYPNAVMYINGDGSVTREVCKGKFWHASPGRDGKKIAADTREGEIFLIDFENGGSKMIFSGIKTDEDRCHHPHPTFNPAGDRVLFWANVHGKDNLYLAEVGSVEIPEREVTEEIETDKAAETTAAPQNRGEPRPDVKSGREGTEKEKTGEDAPLVLPDEAIKEMEEENKDKTSGL